MKHGTGRIAAILLCWVATQADATFEIGLSPRAGIARGDSVDTLRKLTARLAEAASYLKCRSDYAFDPGTDVIHLTVDRVQDDSGPIPISYTFPDSMIRVAPEFTHVPDESTAVAFLSETVALEEPIEAILARCGPAERAQVSRIVQNFVVSEFVHELYHDWQNRSARFQTVNRARTALTAARDAVVPDWRSYLESRGVDMCEHDMELTLAEYEACSVQRTFWIDLYGERPEHPVARAIIDLMNDAIEYYRSRFPQP